jgi:hypothetical protein
MSNKSIVIALALLMALVGFVIFQSRKKQEGTLGDAAGPGIEKFRSVDFAQVKRLAISKGKETVEVVRQGDGWALQSSFGYPADGEKIDNLFKELKKMESFEVRGWDRDSHREFEVDDERGVRVRFLDGADKELANVVLGKRAPTKTFDSFLFVRFADEEQVFESAGSPRSYVGGSGKDLEKDYLLEKKLFKIPDENEIATAELIRPDRNLIVERRWIEKPKKTEEKKDGDAASAAPEGEKKEEAKPELEREETFYVASGPDGFQVTKNREYVARSFLNKKDLRVSEAIDPKTDLASIGLDKPQLKVTLKHRKKDDKEAKDEAVTVVFGNAIKDKEAKEGQTAEDKSYYVMLEGAMSGGRIFTIDKWDFNNWNKELKDFKEEEKKEEKKEEPKAEDKKDEASPPAAGQAAPGSPAPTAAPVIPPPPAPQPGEAAAPPSTVRASHILIPFQGAERAPADVNRSKEAARAEAERLHAELAKDASKFADLAKAHSSCPSAKDGGDLGSFGRGVMAKPFEDAAFRLKKDEISGVVETSFGFHIIRRTE